MDDIGLFAGEFTKRVDFEFFYVDLVERLPKTSIWNIVSQSSGIVLGQIRWWGPWRQYTFMPSSLTDTVWNAACLHDIRRFLNAANQARRERRKWEATNQCS